MVVVREGETLGHQRVAARGDRVDLGRRKEVAQARTDLAVIEVADDTAHVVGQVGREPLAGEVPDDGAQLPVLVEGEAVVDADDRRR